jgi:hypothetical protein
MQGRRKTETITGAVLIADRKTDPAGKAFTAQVTAALRLAPDFLALLGDASVGNDGRWRCGDRVLPLPPAPASIRIHAFSGDAGDAASRNALGKTIILPDGTRMLFLHREALRQSDHLTIHRLARQLHAMPC